MKHSQENTKHERKQRQLASEEALREKNAQNALARLARETAVETACKVFEGVLAKEARAERAEGYRLGFMLKNPVVECYVHDYENHVNEQICVPFAALPKHAQRAAVVALMVRRGEA